MDELSTQQANLAEKEFWNSNSGKKWVDFQNELDTLTAAVKDRLLQRAALKSGERVLDIGCGSGAVSMGAALLVGNKGDVLGADISQPLLDCAKSRIPEVLDGNIDYILADAQTHDFKMEHFDVVVSRFGVMFFAEPVAAFENIAKALRPGGRMSFVCWSHFADNPWFSIPRAAAIAQMGTPAPMPPRAPGPTAFADVDYALGVLKGAGLVSASVATETVNLLYAGGVEDAANLASNVGPASRIVKEFNGTPDDLAAIKEKVAGGLQQYAVEGGVKIPAILSFYEAIKA